MIHNLNHYHIIATSKLQKPQNEKIKYVISNSYQFHSHEK